MMLTIFLFVFSVDLFAQCDSSFFYFKRTIIAELSDDLDLELNIKIPEKTIKLEFSDYQNFSYTISDAKSTLGFVCMRNKVCNNYPDSFCIINGTNKNTFNVERTLFENFMSSDDLKICDSINYLHTLCKVVETPIDGWSKLEDYYFRFINNDDLKNFYNGKSVSLIIPIYIFLDKKLKQTFFYTIKINGTQKENIAIEKKQMVNNE